MRSLLPALALLLCGLSLAAGAATEADPRSMDWQKVDLESQLTQKLRSEISSTVPNGKFIVNVHIQLKPRAKARGKAGGAASDAGLIPLGKLNLDAPAPLADKASAEGAGILANIAKLNVLVLLDSSVPEAKQEIINRIVQSLTDPIVGEGGAEIDFDRLEIAGAHAAESRGALSWLLELKGILAALFAALALSAVALVWLREYRSLELRKLQLLEQQIGARPERAFETQVVEKPQSESIALPEPAAMPGFQKFRTVIREDRERAITLLKQWIKAGSPESLAALAGLPYVLETKELVTLLSYLRNDEKRVWRRIIDQGRPLRSDVDADAFISSQVVSALLSVHSEFDNELVQKVSELDMDSCLGLSEDDASLGAVLAMILPSSQLASFYDRLRPEIVNEIIETMMTMTEDRAKELSSRLSAAIAKLGARQSSAPVANRVDDLLRNAKPEHESAIFDLLARSENVSLLHEAARQYFPSELVASLPPPVLKACLGRFAGEKLVEIVYSRDKERAALLGAVGAPGSKARDLIDLELDRLAKDEVRAKRVAKHSAELWKSFVGAVRDHLRRDEEARDQAGELLKTWLADKTGGQHGSAA